VTTAEKLMTAEEFACLPEPPEGGKMELVDGRVVSMPPTSGGHGERSADVGSMLRTFSRQHGLGRVGTEIGFTLARDPDIVFGPDVAFLTAERIAESNWEEGFIEGPPTLAVEVVSPNDRMTDVQKKVDTYLAYGTARVWVVEPKTRTVTVHRPGGDSHTFHTGESLSSDDAAFAVDGFELPLDELFS
jgi:Uma2 family endonuclease